MPSSAAALQLFVVVHVSLAYSIAGRTVALKSPARVDLSYLDFNTSFTELNAFEPALILRDISFSMSRRMFIYLFFSIPHFTT